MMWRPNGDSHVTGVLSGAVKAACSNSGTVVPGLTHPMSPLALLLGQVECCAASWAKRLESRERLESSWDLRVLRRVDWSWGSRMCETLRTDSIEASEEDMVECARVRLCGLVEGCS